MDELSKKILAVIQSKFPVESQPFKALANRLGVSEEEIRKATAKLKQKGYILSIGAVFDAERLGYVSTLVAAVVEEEKLEAFAAEVSAMGTVSHNFARHHRVNVWFTLTMQDKQLIKKTIEYLKQTYGLSEIYDLPAIKRYKIKVIFSPIQPADHPDEPPFAWENGETEHLEEAKPTKGRQKKQFSEKQKSLIRSLQEDMPLIDEPFRQMAEEVKLTEKEVLEQIKRWKAEGVIRRFGARVQHNKMGYTANAMAAFEIPAGQIDEAGEALALYPQVSHCYQRIEQPDWPYNLYAMIHCRSQRELNELAEQIVQKIHPISYEILATKTQYKRNSIKFFSESVA